MIDPLHARHGRSDAGTHHDRRALAITAAVAALACAVIAVVQRGGDGDTVSASTITAAPADLTSGAGLDGTVTTLVAPGADPTAAAGVTTTLDPAAVTTVPGASADTVGDLDGGEDTAGGACTLTEREVRLGDAGSSVSCLQQALLTTGFYSGTVSGTFDQATADAVEALQTERDMFVDGVVGRETAISLGIWPDEASLVVHTPPPPEGAVDLWGYTLSYVATSGPDAPPLPENSGSGYRVVYDRAQQRVWAVDENEQVIRSWLVSGSKYNNEEPGTHYVYSKSEKSTAWNGKAILPLMVRYQKTRIGNIGFHGIPRHVSDGSRYQTDQELGTRLSGGCQRQADLDAAFMWDFADIGTKVVVL